MYEKPTIYSCQKAATGEEIQRGKADLLAVLQSHALNEVIAAANANGDYLDPNSVIVKVTVEARAL